MIRHSGGLESVARPRLLTLVLLTIAMAGCSVYLASIRPPYGSVESLEVGLPEPVIVRMLGRPDEWRLQPDGTAELRYTFDSEPQRTSPWVYLVCDLLVFPEAFFTMNELSYRLQFERYAIHLDQQRRVREVYRLLQSKEGTESLVPMPVSTGWAKKGT